MESSDEGGNTGGEIEYWTLGAVQPKDDDDEDDYIPPHGPFAARRSDDGTENGMYRLSLVTLRHNT
jgi:hypothetical protein